MRLAAFLTTHHPGRVRPLLVAMSNWKCAIWGQSLAMVHQAWAGSDGAEL